MLSSSPLGSNWSSRGRDGSSIIDSIVPAIRGWFNGYDDPSNCRLQIAYCKLNDEETAKRRKHASLRRFFAVQSSICNLQSAILTRPLPVELLARTMTSMWNR
jgi:hypothetical protein